jgi:hypothetical protein
MELRSLVCKVEPFSVGGVGGNLTGFAAKDIARVLQEHLWLRLERKRCTVLMPDAPVPPGAIVIRGRFLRIDQGSHLRMRLTRWWGYPTVEVRVRFVRDKRVLLQVDVRKTGLFSASCVSPYRHDTEQVARSIGNQLFKHTRNLAKQL